MHEPRLFTSAHRRHHPAGDATRLSPRAAFQEALHRRAVLIDIRRPAQRLARGSISPQLEPVIADLTTLGGRLAESQGDQVILVDQTGEESREICDSLRRFGRGRVRHVTGGFDAWVQDGMPVGDAAPGDAE